MYPPTITLEEVPNPELTDMTLRFWWSVALSLPVFLLAMSEMVPGQPIQEHALARFSSPGFNLRWQRQLYCGVAGHFFSAVGPLS